MGLKLIQTEINELTMYQVDTTPHRWNNINLNGLLVSARWLDSSLPAYSH